MRQNCVGNYREKEYTVISPEESENDTLNDGEEGAEENIVLIERIRFFDTPKLVLIFCRVSAILKCHNFSRIHSSAVGDFSV